MQGLNTHGAVGSRVLHTWGITTLVQPGKEQVFPSRFNSMQGLGARFKLSVLGREHPVSFPTVTHNPWGSSSVRVCVTHASSGDGRPR